MTTRPRIVRIGRIVWATIAMGAAWGCGAAAPSQRPADGVELRLGCEVVTSASVDAALEHEEPGAPVTAARRARMRERIAREVLGARAVDSGAVEVDDASIANMRVQLGHATIAYEDGDCFERVTPIALARLDAQRDGVLDTARARQLAFELGMTSIDLGPYVWWPQSFAAAIEREYSERGYLEAELEPPRLTRDRVTLRVHRGPRYKLGTIRMVARRPPAEEGAPDGGEQAWRARLRTRTGEPVVRSELVEWLRLVQREHARTWGVATVVEAEPTFDREHGVLDLVVRVVAQ